MTSSEAGECDTEYHDVWVSTSRKEAEDFVSSRGYTCQCDANFFAATPDASLRKRHMCVLGGANLSWETGYALAVTVASSIMRDNGERVLGSSIQEALNNRS